MGCCVSVIIPIAGDKPIPDTILLRSKSMKHVKSSLFETAKLYTNLKKTILIKVNFIIFQLNRSVFLIKERRKL